MGGDPGRGATQPLRQPGDAHLLERRPRRLARAVLLGEPVHDRVAAVGQHDEQHAAAVVRGAPQRLDAVERRPVADDRHDRAARVGHPHADRGRQAEAEPAHRGAEEPERGPGREQPVQVGAARRRLLDDDGLGREPLRQRGHHVRGPQRLAARRGPAGGTGRLGRRGRRGPGGQALREGGAHGGGAGDDRELHRAVVGVLEVVGDQRDRRAGVDERALLVGVLAEHRGADGQHDVVAGQRLAQPRPAGGQVPGEQRVVLREAGARGERLLPDRGAQALGQRDQRGPGGGVVGVGADDQRRRVGAGQQVGQRVERGRVGVRPAVQLRRGGERRVVGRLGPVVAGHDHQRRPAAVVRLVPGPGDRARHVLRPGRLVHPHRVVAGQPGEVARQERPVDEVAPVLLPDDHHQRHAVGARGRECTDGVAQARPWCAG